MKKRPLSDREKYIRRRIKNYGDTRNAAIYRWRLAQNLKRGRSVQEARGHGNPTSRERRVQKPKSKTAKSLGYDPRELKRRIIVPKSGTVEGKPQQFFGFAHLGPARAVKKFYGVVLPAASAWKVRLQARGGTLAHRFIYAGANAQYEGAEGTWSTEWSLSGDPEIPDDVSSLVADYEDLRASGVFVKGVYLAEFS